MLNENYIISNALERLGKVTLSLMALHESNWEKLMEYAKIAELEANKNNDWATIEPLWVCGLVYG